MKDTSLFGLLGWLFNYEGYRLEGNPVVLGHQPTCIKPLLRRSICWMDLFDGFFGSLAKLSKENLDFQGAEPLKGYLLDLLNPLKDASSQ